MAYNRGLPTAGSPDSSTGWFPDGLEGANVCGGLQRAVWKKEAIMRITTTFDVF